MCATCGCSGSAVIWSPGAGEPLRAGGDGPRDGTGHDRDRGHEHGHDGQYGHDQQHGHVHLPDGSHADDRGAAAGQDEAGRTVALQQKVLAKNDEIAQRNREWLCERGIFAVNLMSSPGAGKTTLLERAGRELAGRLAVSVIEGDQETALDADRIRSAGCQVVQINTGAGCHLDAAMVSRALRTLDLPRGSVVMIENVGNLVCPALFDLGEAARVVLASVTEGTDKPLKYPQMFRSADLVVITKTDLMPYVDFDAARCGDYVGQVSPQATMIHLSAVTGSGMQQWYDWLLSRVPAPAADGVPRS
ncbi:MAG TPA: hydrogenase nickel incorporation protein HypB [Streptosporangiaceae bacterium]|nr:hydrogenase nickel incorporation protein HypB [Streptosporangiaceae bacterium]